VLKSYDRFAQLLAHVRSSSQTTTIYALGAVQNICSIDPEFAAECRGEHPILDWLTELTQSDDDRIQHYAHGCLQNIDRTNQREEIARAAREAAANETAASAGGAPIETH